MEHIAPWNSSGRKKSLSVDKESLINIEMLIENYQGHGPLYPNNTINNQDWTVPILA